MSSFEEHIEAATAAREIPGVVLVASDVSGKFIYEKAFGPKSKTEKLSLDSTFIMASCTKLMTSISALQCVERGQIALDDDVSTILTELKDVQILTGFKEGTEEPEFKKAENTITLRQLLSHSSGIGYDGLSPELTRWHASLGDKAPIAGVESMMKRIHVPLLFEPGTSWAYGYSLDWAGLLIMRLNNMTLEAYMQKYIWEPLGIRDITFHLELKPTVREHLVKMSIRGDVPLRSLATKTEQKVKWTDEKLHEDPIIDEYGGGGAIGSAREYMKILKSICADDGKLLTSETIDELFTPQLSEDGQKAYTAHTEFLKQGEMFSSHEGEVKINYGLGGALIMDDKTTGVKSGTLTWSGLPNLLWTVDPSSGLSLFYASNVVPFGDIKSHLFQQLFEKEMYTRAAKL